MADPVPPFASSSADATDGPLSPARERLEAVLAAGARPYVTLKAAMTLDGRIATRHGEARWITGEAARAHAHRLRAGHEGIVVAGSGAPPARLARLERAGVEVIACGTPRPQAGEFLARLRRAGLASLLVEGGAAVHGHVIAQGAADELFLYVAGRLMGDREAPSWCAGLQVSRLAATPRLRLAAPERIGEDVLLRGYFQLAEPSAEEG